MEIISKSFDQFAALILEGVLDAGQVSVVLLAAEDVLQQNQQDLVIDGSGLDFVDSSGLGCFVSIYKQAQNLGRSFTLVGLPAPILEVITITKLDRILAIYPGSLEAFLAEPNSFPG
ncbi:MAG: STAS domain-containing protein [Pseudomonadota bacterium]|nr:STAS domain-containing protein [Pseudomonadota bacterium]